MGSLRTGRTFFGTLYAWLSALFLGAVLLDVVYSSFLNDVGNSDARSALGEVSDFLLSLAALTFLAAIAAIALAWNVPSARNLMAASLLLQSIEFLAPFALFPVLQTAPPSFAITISRCIRLVPLALASFLTLGAIRALFREP